MKFGTNELKKLIKEVLAEKQTETDVIKEKGFGEGQPAKDELSKKREVQLEEEEYEEARVDFEEYSKYEEENLHLLRETNKLLSGLLTQMKTITYFTTPGRTPGEASAEKTFAGAIQEKSEK